MNEHLHITPEELQLIESYILHDMTAEESHAFESQQQTDQSLRQKVKDVRMLLVGVQESSLREKLNEFHQSLGVQEGKKTKAKIALVKYWLMAAAMIAVIAVGYWLFTSRYYQHDQLYSDFYKPDPGLISAMATSDNYAFDHAMIDYKTGNYTAALEAWQNLLKEKPGNDTLNYFVASAYMAMEETEKAIPILEQVSTHSNSYFINDTYWYLGLALLKEGRKTEAIEMIDKSDHASKQELLSKLKE